MWRQALSSVDDDDGVLGLGLSLEMIWVVVFLDWRDITLACRPVNLSVGARWEGRVTMMELHGSERVVRRRTGSSAVGVLRFHEQEWLTGVGNGT
jgi:hypothetical protein